MANNKSSKPERTLIGGSLDIPRMVSGLWQLAGGHDQNVDVEAAAKAMEPLIEAGLDCFDMADHYGDAELVMGQHNSSSTKKMIAFTKWCPPENGITTFENAEKAVDLALERMKQEKIELMQYHAWDYTDDSYIQNLEHLRTLQKQGKIGMIGMTNTDAAHLELLINTGFKIATNQVSCSVIDRRHVRGRLVSWLGVEEPKDETELNWSLRKYLRFINAAGGWSSYQVVLQALSTVAKKYGVGISAVATRHVLDLPAVSAVIVGSRLSSTSDKYTVSNLEAFSFALDAEDRALIAKAQEGLSDIPGDCGDEYRRPPFLTAKGDLSDHLEETDHDVKIAKAIAGGARIEYSSGSHWEPIASYSRAIRTGNTIRVSGTTANSPVSSIPAIGGKSARSQTVAILDIVARAIKALGGDLSDVVRTRIFLQKEEDVEAVSLAHGWAFKCAGIRPSNTLVVSGVIGDEFLVEIEVEAELGYREVVRI
ncbi:putative endoribonuclease l-psp protein [Botrytis fragariae]|uniref:Putative endoribonuclease l-psp protein n=1 Tax=Botrytis fragariae TaxID=1964551 RepID=A0A8H6EET2_9HELO|nr:putative endoribonuclease l-psp protein [Botrytis fragariae]KAF5869295.1 putative endoribonuclease l-psp protein [Botrytis fragariae]